MAKTNVDKRMNRIVKKINKDLREDLFGDRFWIRQVKKVRSQEDKSMQYYLYEMIDRKQPERNSYIDWIWGESHFVVSDLFTAINDFIVRSDFWKDYFKDDTRYDIKLDTYRAEYNPKRSA